MSRADRDPQHPSSGPINPVRKPETAGAQPLPRPAREGMEAAFGHDFSSVRVHTDQESAAQAQGMGAQAFTIGRDVHFAAGRYQPESAPGRTLLAHELAHVVQQERGGEGALAEARADAAAAQAMHGHNVLPAALGGAPHSLQMKPEEPAGKAPKEQSAAAPGSWSKTLDRFGHNRAVLASLHRKAIDALAAEIATRVGLVAGGRATITIRGHTDTSGDEKYNEGLGLKRAQAVKAALEAALARKKVGADRIAGITSDSTGETELARETADDVKEPLNRRVVITVAIEGAPSAPSSKPSTPSPDREPEEKPPINFNLPPDYELPEEDWWTRTERERKKIEEYDRTHPRKPKSLNDVLVEGAMKVLEPIIKKFPKAWREKIREGIRKGIESGTEKGCEAAIDATGATGEVAEAAKAACKAALKAKLGERR